MLPEVGSIHQGTVAKIGHNFALLIFPEGFTGLLHISELSNRFIRHFSGYVKIGNIYTVKVIDVEPSRNNVRVSLKQVSSEERTKHSKRAKIEADTIDFSALAEKLPIWIKEELENAEAQS